MLTGQDPWRPLGASDGAAIAAGEERLQLLRSGSEGFDALVALIDSAQRDLRLLFYTFADDRTGRRVLEHLCAARRRGVAVTLIIDDFGSIETPARFFRPLTDAGCTFARFHPRLLQRYLLRNHQKIAIADGDRAIVGSFNVGDVHMRADADDGWRDIGVAVEGPAAARLARYYDLLARWVGSRRPTMRSLRRLLTAANETEGAVRWVFGGPARGYNNYVRQVRREFARARSADLIMAYFAPSPSVLQAVKRVARDGRFRLIAAGKTDVMLSRAAAWHTYRTLLKSGAQIFEYQPRALHSKLIIVDDAVFIGSGNFDVRSLYVNLEVMLRVERPDLVAAACDMFDAELADSQRIDLDALRARRRWYKRIWWRAAYFLVATVDLFLSRRLAS
jgi:cardiolipin synthase